MILDESCELSAKKIFNLFYNKTVRKLGQNFLFDKKINNKIVSFAGDLSGKIVVEVGPGPGGLTLEILRRNISKLYILEVDHHWAEVWRTIQKRFSDKLEIIEGDALKFDMNSINPNVIISNLPYNISTQLFFKWLPELHKYEKLILMFQKEVAERLCAKPCTKAYGKLSVLAQWKADISKMCDVVPGSFYPVPKVVSTVVKFCPYRLQTDVHVPNFDAFSSMLTDIFTHRRKIVLKALAKYLSNPEEIIHQFGYDKSVRADQISVINYVNICKLSK